MIRPVADVIGFAAAPPPPRLGTHILSFEGEAHVEWFEGNFEAYEEDKVRRLGPDSIEPKRVKYKKFTR